MSPQSVSLILNKVLLRRRLSPSSMAGRLRRCFSTAAAVDAAKKMKLKINQLEEPDPRFLCFGPYGSVQRDYSPVPLFPQTRVSTLSSGLRIATESNMALQTATVGVWIDTGSRFETKETNGVAHFLEHMIFKGTSNRTEKALVEEMENMGGHLNACTSRERTAYYAKVMGSDVPQALDILADILQNSVLDENMIHQERNVILGKQEEVEGHLEEVLFDHLHATAFQHTPLGRTILGPAENIKRMTKQHIEEYIYSHYAPHRMVVVGAGAVNHEDIVELVKKLFAKLPSSSITSSELVSDVPAVFTGSEVCKVEDDIAIAQLAVAFEGASWTDPDSIALMVMKFMLGSWNKNMGSGKQMGSGLVQRMTINDYAESVMAFNTNYKDTGLFGVYATAKPDCLKDVCYSIMKDFCNLYYQVSDADVTRARNQLKSSLLLQLDGTSPVAEDIGRQLITYDRRIPFAELFARIDAVDASRVKRVAGRFIVDKDIAIAAMGPIKTLPSYNWFREKTFRFRF